MKWSSIPKTSKKKRRQQRAEIPCREFIKARSGGLCEIQSEVCTRAGVVKHEILPRGRGGDPTDPLNTLWTCDACHKYSHAHSEWAELHGFLKSQFVMGKHEARQTPTALNYFRQVEGLHTKTFTKGQA